MIFEKIRPDVEVEQIPIPGGEETYILCRTTGRKEKGEGHWQPFREQDRKISS
jgi:hypothetical protein